MADGLMMEDIADALWPEQQQGCMCARGKVTAVAGGKVTVKMLGGTGIECSKLAAYAPAVGDKALCLKALGGWVALGKIG